jgi:NAD(P)-dependent dehydrogenase (short-subunit alcohol dehydrogenase family)
MTAISYRRDVEAAEAVVSAIARRGGQGRAYRAPAEDSLATATVVDEINSAFGPIDLLVSNAGTASTGRSVLDTEPPEFDELMRIHALGPVALMQAVRPRMASTRSKCAVADRNAVRPSGAVLRNG